MNPNIFLHLHVNKIVHIPNSSYYSSNDRLWHIFHIKKTFNQTILEQSKKKKKKAISKKKKITINKLVFQYPTYDEETIMKKKKKKKIQ